ncbi:hypothetical protein FBZ94_1155 [Bradyrhizobium sacchari]|uniref:Uncharacterized protein n=1 Tax=Bradyrhizobium sacchari TaxID=1399419 RepID=A0A560J9J0_9BRAD|nr:hypothetical protein FBZ94_1155 [Bradyrhizobium sacchari]TWB67667.1 hypothetical protein FBZ95_1145 [Bradyrhizobium sacchari]
MSCPNNIGHSFAVLSMNCPTFLIPRIILPACSGRAPRRPAQGRRPRASGSVHRRLRKRGFRLRESRNVLRSFAQPRLPARSRHRRCDGDPRLTVFFIDWRRAGHLVERRAQGLAHRLTSAAPSRPAVGPNIAATATGSRRAPSLPSPMRLASPPASNLLYLPKQRGFSGDNEHQHTTRNAARNSWDRRRSRRRPCHPRPRTDLGEDDQNRRRLSRGRWA